MSKILFGHSFRPSIHPLGCGARFTIAQCLGWGTPNATAGPVEAIRAAVEAGLLTPEEAAVVLSTDQLPQPTPFWHI